MTNHMIKTLYTSIVCFRIYRTPLTLRGGIQLYILCITKQHVSLCLGDTGIRIIISDLSWPLLWLWHDMTQTKIWHKKVLPASVDEYSSE